MRKALRIDVPLYRRKIVAYIGHSFSEMEKALKKEFGISVEEWVDSKFHVGAVWSVRNIETGMNSICFWSAKPEDIENFSHEVFHLTDMIMTDAGVKLSDDSNEAWAYLHGYLFKKLYKPKKL